MSQEVNLPALGESVTEGTVTRWLKKVGDTVAVDEPLVEISTDKVDTEIPSPIAGVIEEILVAEDETVEVGAVLARIGDGKQATIEMAKVTAPTFLIWGTGDPLLPKSAADTTERYLANAPISVALMPDVGHYPPLEVPDRFARLIADYVEAIVPRP